MTGHIAVPIDVLRANTTMTTALANGCVAVKPFASVEDATRFRTTFPHGAGNILCGGERGGVKIAGFDLGNSPLEYGRSAVQDRTLAFTTTNGTQAIASCLTADQIALGSFVNITALVNFLSSCERVALVCAGVRNNMAGEDVLFAGAVAERLCTDFGFKCPSTQYHLGLKIARTFWQTAQQRLNAGVTMESILSMTEGGKDLVNLNFLQDIEFAGRFDVFDIVPIYNRDTGYFTAMSI